MCGLVFSTNPTLLDDDFIRAVDALKQRGPDGQTSWRKFNLRLGHSLLAVQSEVSMNTIEFETTSGTVYLAFNGEVYNSSELATKFLNGRKFESDSELVANLFAACGPSFIPSVNGMFAFVAIDEDLNFLIARDPLGIKPLFWTRNNNGYSVASSIRSLSFLGIDMEENTNSLSQYLNLRSPIGDNTFYINIEQFPAGNFFWKGQLSNYWSPEWNESPRDSRFQEVLNDSIERQVSSSLHRVGALLSGGVDSSYIFAASGVNDSFTAGTIYSNEFSEADQVCAHLKRQKGKKYSLDSENYERLAQDLVNSKMEPLSLPNEVLLSGLFSEISKSHRVILSGEGADEILGGYSRIFEWAASRRKFDLAQFASLYSYSEVPELEVFDEAMQPHIEKHSTPSHIVTSFFLQHHLKVLLGRLDFASMESGVEARVPFLDTRIVEEFAFAPFSWKSKGGISKFPLRVLAAEQIGNTNAFREKIGFPVSFENKRPPTNARIYKPWFRSQISYWNSRGK